MAKKGAKKGAKEEEKEEVQVEVKTGSGRFVFDDGSVYNGEWRDEGKGDGKLRSGRGVFTQPDGTTYEGEWVNGRREGQGTLTLQNGDQYVGGFSAGCFQGQGNFVSKGGSSYSGEWRAGKMDGVGELVDSNGGRFRGIFRQGAFVEDLGFYVSPADDTEGPFDAKSYVPRGVGPNPTERVLNAWFRGFQSGETLPAELSALWKGEDGAERARIKRELERCYRSAQRIAGGMQGDARGSLALLVLLGPVARILGATGQDANTELFTDTAKASSARGDASKVPQEAAVFFYDAFARAEDKELSDAGAKQLAGVLESESASEELKAIAQALSAAAKETVELVAQFGRDPRRNAALGRENTEDESKWLTENGFLKAPAAAASAEEGEKEESK